MRAPAILVPLALALTVAAGLSACSKPAPPPPPRAAAPVGPPPVPASATAIRGRLTIDGLKDLPTGLNLHLRLLDMSDPSIAPPVLSQRVEPAPGDLPYNYALPYDKAAIKEDGRYAVEATLTADDFVMYSTSMPSPALSPQVGDSIPLVLSRGSPTASADIAPADVMKADFERLEGSIGALRRLTGQRIEGDMTVGWDAFADETSVRFAREAVDYGSAGKASYRYAYKDGAPWVIAREQGGTLSLVGWAGDGTLTLNRVGDNNGGLDEAEIARLRKLAEDAFANATAKL